MEDRRRLMILIAATAGAVLIPLNTSMLAIALAPIVAAFGVSNAAGAWLILLYLAVMTSLQATAGKMGDRYGHRSIFLGALLLFAIASAGAALAPSFRLLIAARALQGFAGAALAPNAVALIRLSFPMERQGYAMGLYVGVFSAGLTVGPVIGGLLLAWWGWTAVFWVNLPTVLLAAWIGFLYLPKGHVRTSVAFDWAGTSLFSALVMAIVLGANLWKDGQLPVPLWVLLAALVLLGGLLAYVEERAPDPLVRFSLFRLPGFAAANAAILLLHTIMYAILLAVPLYLQQGRGFSPTLTGLVMAGYALMQVLVSPLSGRLSDRFGRRLPVLLGSLCYVGGTAILWSVVPASALWWVVLALLLGGTGTGLVSSPVQAAAVVACPPEQVGLGSGVWYSSRYLGNIGGALIAGLLLPQNAALGAAGLYAVLLVVALLLLFTSQFLPRRTLARAWSLKSS